MAKIIPNALSTLARTKVFMGIGSDKYDTLLVQFINQTTGFIERFCKRTFKETTYTSEVYDGKGTDTIILAQFPVGSVTSFQYRNTNDETDDWTTFSTADYRTYNDGRLVKVAGLFEDVPRKYRVTYVAGYKIDFDNEDNSTLHALPSELEYACQKLVASLFNTRKAEGYDLVVIGDSRIKLNSAVLSSDEIKAILEKYVAPTI